ncbi:hypothetical protein, partial [Raoultella ornithinolytica]
DGGAMRLIQTSRPHNPVAPVSAAPPGEFPGWRRDAPYPDFPTAQPRSPGKRSATGRVSRIAALCALSRLPDRTTP